MNTLKRIKSICAALAAFFVTLAGLDVQGLVAIFPPEYRGWLIAIPTGAAVIVHVLEAFPKLLDAIIKALDPFEDFHLLIGLLALTMLLPACTIIRHADGSWSASPDPGTVDSATRAIIIHATK